MGGKHEHGHRQVHGCKHVHEHPDDHGGPHAHPRSPALGERDSSLSRRDKLIIRLEHDIRHNSQHADTSRGLAAEASELGEDEAASLIRAAAEHTALVNESLQKALAVLKAAQGS